MNANLLLILQVILGLAVALAVLGGVGYALYRYWRVRIPRQIRATGTKLRSLSVQATSLVLAAQAYPSSDPEPYGARAAALYQALAALDGRRRTAYQQYTAAHQAQRQAPLPGWRGILLALPGQYHLLQQIGVLNRSGESLSVELSKAQAALAHLGQVPWEVSQQTRQVQERLQAASLALAGLHERHVQGKAFAEAAAQEAELRQQFSRIPLVFLSASQEKLVGAVSKAETVAVYQQIGVLVPALERLHDQLRTWGTLHEQAYSSHSTLQGTLARAGAQLEALPGSVQLDAEHQQLDVLMERMSALQQRLGEPEAEGMLAITQEAVSATHQAQQLLQLLEQTGKQAAELSGVVSSAQAALQDLSRQLDSLARHPAAALVWDISSPRQVDLQRIVEAVGGIEKKRSPDQLAAELSRISNAATRLIVLNRQVAQAVNLHQALCQHLSRLERTPVLGWLEKAGTLGKQITTYYAGNWNDDLDAGSFPNQLADFRSAFDRLIPASGSITVKESALPDREVEIGRLGAELAGLQAREVELRLGLAELQAREVKTRASLDALNALFRQVGLLAKGNSRLGELANTELARLSTEASQAEAAFKQKRLGTVDKKALRVESLEAAAERAANRWLGALEQDNQTHRTDIRNRLESLKGVAPLDDTAIMNANDLLAASLHLTSRAGEESSDISLEAIFLPLKKANEDWQHLLAASHALEDLERPVNEAYQRALQAREKARSQLGSLPRLARDDPNYQTLEGYKAELTALELQWQALRSQPVRVLSLLTRLGDLTTRYELVAEKARQLIDRMLLPPATPQAD